ncbi:hypothetical protein AKJ09_09947 [Labilithrix luteola]|uniref:Uncharacterized protein n=1 Tax=Labilithrix luteola TaxID=1391654 RepID=A0A0K1QC13_9BACT|nr:hypothetical protein AKJ09_09947 [Labilithrix luteola]
MVACRRRSPVEDHASAVLAGGSRQRIAVDRGGAGLPPNRLGQVLLGFGDEEPAPVRVIRPANPPLRTTVKEGSIGRRVTRAIESRRALAVRRRVGRCNAVIIRWRRGVVTRRAAATELQKAQPAQRRKDDGK